MSKVDDELTRRLHQAERPVDGDDLFEGLQRRRTHRERLRRIQAGLVAFAVLAATAGGFVVLREAFDGNGRDVGESMVLAGNGQIVFSREGDDGRLHVFVSHPDGSGVRQITNGSTNDFDPAVSPDGRTVAFVRILDERTQRIAIVGIDGGEATNLTVDSGRAAEPAWSPDGTTLAYVTTGIDSMQIATIGIENKQIHYLIDFFGELADPTWSVHGATVSFAARGRSSSFSSDTWDLATVARGDATSDIEPLLVTDRDEESPAWSPDGTRLAFIRPGDDGDGIWTVAPNGTDETLIATAVEASLDPDLVWAPDGTSLLVSDGDWIYHVDATPAGDPRENFVRLMQGQSPSWQPLPAGSDPPSTATPEPSVSLEPGPDGQDIGLGVLMCDLEILDGIDWDGTGIDGAAWTGAPVDEDGGCSSAADVQHIVAVDRDGDGVAEQGSTSTLRTCLLCRPFDTVDLNDDGVLELVVLEEASSTPTYSVFEVNRPGSERAEGVYPIIVVAPGAHAMNLDAGDAVRFTVGGDEGFSGSIECEDAGAGPPILRYTWVRGEVDADTELRVDITRLWFGEDGVFHIESVDHFNVPRNPEPTELRSTEPACGVDFHPDA